MFVFSFNSSCLNRIALGGMGWDGKETYNRLLQTIYKITFFWTERGIFP